MRVFKIMSGILSIIISLVVIYQSFFAGLLEIVTSSGQPSGVAGLIVAVMLLAGGILSIASSGGSMGADIALISLYGIGALLGFTMAGDYTDLMIWAFWCLLCAALALIDYIILYRSDDEDDNYYEQNYRGGPDAPVSLRSLIFEQNSKKRDAAIDALPEQEAKSYLKQIVAAFINREPIKPPGIDDDDEPSPGRTVMTIVIAVIGVCVIGFGSFAVVNLIADRALNDPAPAESQSPQPTLEQTAAPTAFHVGDTWTVDGQWTLTITGVTETDERNQYSDKEPGAVYFVDYTYTNTGYTDNGWDGLYISIDGTVVDRGGKMGGSYPNTVQRIPAQAPVGATCDAQACIYVENPGDFQLTVSKYDGNGIRQSAVFELSVS